MCSFPKDGTTGCLGMEPGRLHTAARDINSSDEQAEKRIYIYMCVCLCLYMCVCLFVYVYKSLHRKAKISFN